MALSVATLYFIAPIKCSKLGYSTPSSVIGNGAIGDSQREAFLSPSFNLSIGVISIWNWSRSFISTLLISLLIDVLTIEFIERNISEDGLPIVPIPDLLK